MPSVYVYSFKIASVWFCTTIVLRLTINKEIEYIAYNGDAYTIEWYFNDLEKSQALDYFHSLNTKEKN